jgi:hypothetical protein
MAISALEAQGLLMKATVQKFKELRTPTTHLLGYFTPKTYNTTEVPIAVMRDRELMSSNVLRGTNGKLNQQGSWSEKTIIPPYFHERFAINTLQSYERGFSGVSEGTVDDSTAQLINDIATETVKMQNKVIRAQEQMSAQALETGVVTLDIGYAVDYKRKSTSLVDNTSDSWTNAGAKIEQQFQDAGNFLRVNGGYTGGELDATMSSSAWIALQATDYFKTKANYQQVTLMAINAPVSRNGATYHGRITCGAYVVNIWVYDGYYTTDAGVVTRFTDETKVIIVPTMGTVFEMAYGAVDQKVKNSGASPMSVLPVRRAASDFYVWDNVDYNNMVHDIHLASAPIARLISVDMVYTMKVSSSLINPVVG